MAGGTTRGLPGSPQRKPGSRRRATPVRQPPVCTLDFGGGGPSGTPLSGRPLVTGRPAPGCSWLPGAGWPVSGCAAVGKGLGDLSSCSPSGPGRPDAPGPGSCTSADPPGCRASSRWPSAGTCPGSEDRCPAVGGAGAGGGFSPPGAGTTAAPEPGASSPGAGTGVVGAGGAGASGTGGVNDRMMVLMVPSAPRRIVSLPAAAPPATPSEAATARLVSTTRLFFRALPAFWLFPSATEMMSAVSGMPMSARSAAEGSGTSVSLIAFSCNSTRRSPGSAGKPASARNWSTACSSSSRRSKVPLFVLVMTGLLSVRGAASGAGTGPGAAAA